jgi:hypothetical protein
MVPRLCMYVPPNLPHFYITTITAPDSVLASNDKGCLGEHMDICQRPRAMRSLPGKKSAIMWCDNDQAYQSAAASEFNVQPEGAGRIAREQNGCGTVG